MFFNHINLKFSLLDCRTCHVQLTSTDRSSGIGRIREEFSIAVLRWLLHAAYLPRNSETQWYRNWIWHLHLTIFLKITSFFDEILCEKTVKFDLKFCKKPENWWGLGFAKQNRVLLWIIHARVQTRIIGKLEKLGKTFIFSFLGFTKNISWCAQWIKSAFRYKNRLIT